MTAADTVMSAIQNMTFGPATTIQNLTMIPIVGGLERRADYLTLDEALSARQIEVTEISDAASVPELRVTVKGDTPVLLLDGEELIGAKQNRVLNLTILAPPHHTMKIPVSCVEAGRWRHVSQSFGTSARTQFAEGRAAKMRQVTESLLSLGERRSDQSEVWDLIAEKSARLEARSETSAMSAMFEKLDASLDECVHGFAPLEGQIGALFLIDGTPAGLELFDAPATWRKLAPKLVRSYAVDAVDRQQQPGRRAGKHDAPAFVQTIVASTASIFPAVGAGEDVRITGPDVNAAGLVAAGRAIHVSAFAAVD